MIALIDYGAGNLRSVHKALRHLGADVQVVTEPGPLTTAHAAVLPGVGAFDDCLNAIDRQQLREATCALIRSGRPFLGICVGYQALFERSDEFASRAPGLALFSGRVVRFAGATDLKVPQIGWNQVHPTRPDCPLFRGIPDGTHFYFVHSFFPKPADETVIAAHTTYGERFASALWHERTFATQFHPEKSQEAGLQLLKNFLEVAGRA